MASANNSAPPSFRSSRFTLVITANFSPMAATASATRARLVVIHRQRRAFLHRAEPAAPRAHVAQDHERGRAMVPALAHVGAGGALADRVQPQPLDQRLQFAIILAHRRGSAQPLRALRLGVSDGNQHYFLL